MSILWILPGALVLLLLVAVIRALGMGAKTADYVPSPEEDRALAYGEKLGVMVRCDTTSRAGQEEPEKYRGFHKVLAELFPLVFEKLEYTELEGSLLLFWKGKDSRDPILLLSHMDVVPAEGTWLHEPFSGDIADGKVWGRGSVDTKASLMAFLQAAEELLAEGFQPERDVYLASSCTEEWGGPGAPRIVEELKRRGVSLYMVCDEGGAVITDPIGGVKGNFALIGAFEKGRADVKFTARSAGGHASAPGKNSPIARLSALVTEAEKGKLFRRKILPEVEAMFRRMAPYAPFGLKLVMGNVWLFGPLLKRVLPGISAQAGAMLQTTMAFTMQSGSHACNVLPQEATLGANLRFIPHQGMEESLAVAEKLAKRHGVEMEVLNGDNYSRPVDIHGEAFRQVEEVVRETFPGLPSTPYVVTGGTDCIFFEEISQNCIRFVPVIYGPEQMAGMHGLNECIEYSCLPGAVDFYKNLIRIQKQRG